MAKKKSIGLKIVVWITVVAMVGMAILPFLI
jgi:hypothetical protein